MDALRCWARMVVLGGLLGGCGDSGAVTTDVSAGQTQGPITSTTSGGGEGASDGLPSSSTTNGSTGSVDPVTTSGSATSTGPQGPPDHVPPGFLNPADAGPWSSWACSMWLEDCPAGEKCAPYANDGGSAWNATRCVPIAPDPAQPGEPCTVEGPLTSGMDDCALHSMCWQIDQETGQGTCRGFCIGSESYPSCAEPAHSCSLSGDGTTPLCLPTCDPLAQACQAGFGCYPASNTYVCVPDASGGMGGPGEPCRFINSCDPGLACAQSQTCTSARCCTAFCSLSEPMCLEEASCVPVYDDATAPLGAEDVGVCAGAA